MWYRLHKASPSKRKRKENRVCKVCYDTDLHEANPSIGKRKEKSKENKVCTVFYDKDCMKQVLQKEKRKENK